MNTAILQRNRIAPETLLSDRFYRGRFPSPSFPPAPMIPTTMEAERPLAMPFGEGAFLFESAPDDWILPLLQQLCELGSLPANWNSYGARPIRLEVATEVVAFLLNYLSPDDPLPSIVPTARGGILLEWHEGGIDLEVDIRSPSWIHVAFEDGENEEEFDHADFEIVEQKLNCLRSRLQ